MNVRVVVAPEVAEPRAILVVLPDAPAVPILIVLVLPDAVTPAWMFVVCDTVDWPSVIVPVPDAPPAVKTPVVWEVPRLIVLVVVENEIEPPAESVPPVRMLSAPSAYALVAVTFVPATGTEKYVPNRFVTVVAPDAAIVWAAKLFM